MDRHRLPPKPGKPGKRKLPNRMPLWLTVTLCVLVLVIGGLIAAESMMRAYITQRVQERAEAQQRVIEAYPMVYRDLIEQYAEANNLRPAYVAAIILNESSYRTDAESSVGARGLMRLMPDTAEWIAGKLDVENYSFAMMYDAETNLRFGTWYLGYLGKLFQGDPTLVACAFHAGQGEVRGWLSDPALSEDGVTLKLENLADGPTVLCRESDQRLWDLSSSTLRPGARLLAWTLCLTLTVLCCLSPAAGAANVGTALPWASIHQDHHHLPALSPGTGHDEHLWPGLRAPGDH